jgi:predicted GIY-YIG superfamily endonuclease
MKIESFLKIKFVFRMEVLYTYVLKLEEGKWYVGKTNDPWNRLTQHVNENGSAWTRKYPPLQVHEVKPHASKFDEDNVTLEYMGTYGIDNVRGGCYVQVVLPPEQSECASKPSENQGPFPRPVFEKDRASLSLFVVPYLVIRARRGRRQISVSTPSSHLRIPNFYLFIFFFFFFFFFFMFFICEFLLKIGFRFRSGWFQC